MGGIAGGEGCTMSQGYASNHCVPKIPGPTLFLPRCHQSTGLFSSISIESNYPMVDGLQKFFKRLD